MDVRNGPKRYLGLGLITAAVYVASAKLGLTLAFVAQQVTVVWPPTGIALAAVLLLGFRIWPFIFLGTFIANITTNTPLLTSIGIASGNTLEALTAAWLLQRFVGFDRSLQKSSMSSNLTLFYWISDCRESTATRSQSVFVPMLLN